MTGWRDWSSRPHPNPRRVRGGGASVNGVTYSPPPGGWGGVGLVLDQIAFRVAHLWPVYPGATIAERRVAFPQGFA